MRRPVRLEVTYQLWEEEEEGKSDDISSETAVLSLGSRGLSLLLLLLLIGLGLGLGLEKPQRRDTTTINKKKQPASILCISCVMEEEEEEEYGTKLRKQVLLPCEWRKQKVGL